MLLRSLLSLSSAIKSPQRVINNVVCCWKGLATLYTSVGKLEIGSVGLGLRPGGLGGWKYSEQMNNSIIKPITHNYFLQHFAYIIPRYVIKLPYVHITDLDCDGDNLLRESRECAMICKWVIGKSQVTYITSFLQKFLPELYMWSIQPGDAFFFIRTITGIYMTSTLWIRRKTWSLYAIRLISAAYQKQSWCCLPRLSP